MPNTETVRPKQAIVRASIGLSMCKKSKTNRTKPSHPKLLSGKGSPKRVLLMADRKDTDSRRESPDMGTDRPRHAKLWTSKDEPMWRRSKTSNAKPTHAELCKKVKGSRCKESTKNINDSNLAVPNKNITGPSCPRPRKAMEKFKREHFFSTLKK